MKRILYISNILAHIHSFHLPYIDMLRDRGYIVDVIANSCGVEPKENYNNFYDIPIERNPFSLKNILLIKHIRKIIDDNNYDLIHVHTPMGGVLGRLSAIEARKKGTKIIYTSHGFHFYSGAKLHNWILYYSVEKVLSHYTDCIITINQEDYRRAKKLAPRNCEVIYLDGVGVDLTRFHPKSYEEKKKMKCNTEYNGYTVLFYAAEFIPRKNHKFLINAFRDLHLQNDNTKLLLAGKGPELEKMKKLSTKLGIEDSVVFLGYRKDIPQILEIVDIVVSSSHQEGFPINLAEAVASGIPSVVSNIRGNIDIIQNDLNGFVYKKNNRFDFCKCVNHLINNPQEWKIKSENCRLFSSRIDENNLKELLMNLYSKYIF